MHVRRVARGSHPRRVRAAVLLVGFGTDEASGLPYCARPEARHHGPALPAGTPVPVIRI